MRRSISALVWASLSCGSGLLSILPSFPVFPRRGVAMAQLVATEDPGLTMAAGGIGLWQGLRARSWRAVALALVGLALGVRPLVRRKQVNRAMSDAMRQDLGIGWQRDIPPEMHRRFAQAHRTDTWGPLRYLLRIRVRVTRDVLFAAPDGYPLRLDVYEPEQADGPRPAVVVVHGGAWFQGDKSTYAFGWHDRWLAAQGYVVFDVQYRLSGRWPAPLNDVKCAIRWVRANAARYGVDPGRIALVGRSAGAHLALMAAYTAGDPAYAAGCFSGEGAPEDEVQAVVASYAPSDLRLWSAEPGGAIAALLGGLPDEIPDLYASASPVSHVRSGLPPTLLIHGQRDRLVPPAHSELLANHLRAAGVKTVLLRIPWGRHGVDSLLVGLTGPMIQYDVDRFLAWVFHQKGTEA
ncbi:alpha/beta hydrolase [Aggregatilinea lenta]|uniref:alpha/beta hydrolase n=1 Tax=Aggregatilinea lenta TaxID=913108 RepID=UPI000E5BB7C5|nr:alpha/beta hydrolase [Aggregatilinea lenta]